MATPQRLVELECPHCKHCHWEMDHDYRGAELRGQRELSYDERTYTCPVCKVATTGYRFLQGSPPEFFLQPHPLYPMTTEDFAHWLAVLRREFPSDRRLQAVGVYWYPGEEDDEQTRKLHEACDLGTVEGSRLSLSNHSPDDERILVGVHGTGEAYFWCGPGVDLKVCYFEFEFVVLVVSSAATTARIQSIEQKLNALLAHHGVLPAPGLPLSDRVKELARDPKRKIEAIKVYREETGAGLTESKDTIEAYQQQLRSGATGRPLG